MKKRQKDIQISNARLKHKMERKSVVNIKALHRRT